MKLKTHGLSYFLGKSFFDDDGSENMFVYQAALDMLQFEKDKIIDFALSWK